MTAKKKNLSSQKTLKGFSPAGIRIGIVVSEWNPAITRRLYAGARQVLLDHGILPASITRLNVPGSFELPYGASLLAQKKKISAVICLGCVIKGETRHDEYISQACANGLIQVSLKYSKPVIFGVITAGNAAQARERSGGSHGNKGVEAAMTALRLLCQQP